MRRPLRDQLPTIGAFAAVYLIWGSTYLGVKVVVHAAPPLVAAGVRFVLAGIIVYAWARLRGARAPSRREWGRLALLGALMFVPGYSALFWAQRTLPSGLAAVLVATLPLWTLLLEFTVFRSRQASLREVVAIGAGFLGVLVLSGSAVAGARGGAWFPCIVVFLSESGWAVGSILSRRWALPLPTALSAGAEMMTGGALLVLASGLTGEWAHVTAPHREAVLAMAYLIIFGSVITYSAYVWLLERTPPARLASFTYVNPVIALLIGWVVAGESLPARAISGAALVILSVVLVQVVPSVTRPARPHPVPPIRGRRIDHGDLYARHPRAAMDANEGSVG